MQQGKAGVAKINGRIDRMSVRYARAEAILTSLASRAVLGGTLGTPAVKRAVTARQKRCSVNWTPWVSPRARLSSRLRTSWGCASLLGSTSYRGASTTKLWRC